MKKGLNNVSDFVSKFDLFGKSITFTYKSSEIYQTFLGGMVSMTITLTTIIYFIYICNDMNRGGYSKISETSINAFDKANIYDFEEKGFEFALISTLPVDDLLDPSFYNLDLTIYSFNRNQSGALIVSDKEKPISVNLVK